MEGTIVNINDNVRVALTRSGARILNAYNGHDIDKSVVEMQLWDVMAAFGPHLHMGMIESPFVNNVIELDVPQVIDVDNIEFDGGRYIGKATRGQDGKWTCLADVRGILCRVQVRMTVGGPDAWVTIGGHNAS